MPKIGFGFALNSEVRQKCHFFKNVIFLSFSFTLLFTSFDSMSNLQSSINRQLGTTSLWVIYLSFVTSCILLPSLAIKKLTIKWTIPLSMLCYSGYIGAQLFPRYYTLVPAALMVGLAAAPLWTSSCAYFTQIGEKYSEMFGERKEVSIARFFGIFFFFHQSSKIWGNLISSLVLSKGVTNATILDPDLEICGKDFCLVPGKNETLMSDYESGEDESPQSRGIQILSYILLLSSLASAGFAALFVDPLKRFGINEVSDEGGCQLLAATLLHLKKTKQLLLVPLIAWAGFGFAFFSADFTAGYVTCGIGVHMVGYVMMCSGLTSAFFALFMGTLVKRFGLSPIFALGFLISFGCLVFLRFWKPVPSDDVSLFATFLVGGLWGVADTIWQSQINVLVGTVFEGEHKAAFSNYHLWKSFGFMVTFILSGNVCMQAKLYILTGVLLAAMLGYSVVQFVERKKGFETTDIN